MPASFTDGASNTVLFAEGYAVTGTGANQNFFKWWSGAQKINGVAQSYGPTYFSATINWANSPPYTPLSPPFWVNVTGGPPAITKNDRPDAFTSAGLLVGMADGSVRFVASTVSANTWFLANNPADGTPLPGDW
jgi:hypothetical protein